MGSRRRRPRRNPSASLVRAQMLAGQLPVPTSLPPGTKFLDGVSVEEGGRRFGVVVVACSDPRCIHHPDSPAGHHG